MTFTPNIPQTGQSLGQTRDAVRNNFTNYNTVMSVNHVAPNSAGQGKHTFAEFIVQAQSPATAASEVALYSRTLNGVPQLCLQKQSQALNAADIQMSRVDVGVTGATTGSTFLPGGMVMQWNDISIAVSTGSWTFPVPYTTWVAVLGTAGTQPTTFYVSALSNTAITITRTGSGASSCWVSVIGV